MAPNQLRILAASALIAASGMAQAQVAISGTPGWAKSSQEFTELDASSNEGPLGFTISAELTRFPMRDFRFGVDHTRSLQLAPFSSGLSFSVVSARYYLFGPGPESPAEAGPSVVSTYGLRPFVFGSVGIFQAVAAGATSAGLAFGGGAGWDWVVARSLFFRFEGRYMMGNSNARVKFMGAGLGLGFCL